MEKTGKGVLGSHSAKMFHTMFHRKGQNVSERSLTQAPPPVVRDASFRQTKSANAHHPAITDDEKRIFRFTYRRLGKKCLVFIHSLENIKMPRKNFLIIIPKSREFHHFSWESMSCHKATTPILPTAPVRGRIIWSAWLARA